MKNLKLFTILIVTIFSVQTLHAQNNSWERIWHNDEIKAYIKLEHHGYQFFIKEEYFGNIQEVRAKQFGCAMKVYKCIRIIEFNQDFTSFRVKSADFYNRLDKLIKTLQNPDTSWRVVESQQYKIEAREAKKLYDSEE